MIGTKVLELVGVCISTDPFNFAGRVLRSKFRPVRKIKIQCWTCYQCNNIVLRTCRFLPVQLIAIVYNVIEKKRIIIREPASNAVNNCYDYAAVGYLYAKRLKL